MNKEHDTTAIEPAESVEQLRQRHQCELSEQQKYSGYELMKDLLPMADNLERLILVGRHSGDADALIEGIEIIRDQLFDVLDKHGLREISRACDPFDPDQHESVGDREDREHPDGSVLEVVRSGYRLHDKVVRPSQVIVSRDKVY